MVKVLKVYITDTLSKLKRLTKKALLLLRSPSKPSALLCKAKASVVANIARSQWHLRLVNCAFSGFASLKIALFIQPFDKESDPMNRVTLF